jgi:hypothetical protein
MKEASFPIFVDFRVFRGHQNLREKTRNGASGFPVGFFIGPYAPA